MKRSKNENWKKVKKINLQNLGFITIRRNNMSENIEKWVLEDGRRAEKIVLENKIGEEIERTTEIRVDEDRPKNIQQKIIEKIKPVVYERVTESIDANTGEVVEEKIETMDIKLKEKEDNSFVTRDEMIEAIVTAVKSINSNKTSEQTDLKSLGIIKEIEANSKAISKKDLFLLGIIILQVIGLIYLIIF